ncbi:unnamed protein product, partial [Mesorhabditis spiculigera]
MQKPFRNTTTTCLLMLLSITGIPRIRGQLLSGCLDGETQHYDGERWIHSGNFLVVCSEGKIKVLKCMTDAGTVLEVGTEGLVEDGVTYSCVDEPDEPMHDEGSGLDPELGVHCQDENDMVVDHFWICCVGKKLKGCADDRGNTQKAGHFVVGQGLLKYCNIHPSGLRGRIEPKGCFNGTEYDDPDDEQFHAKKYAIWRQGDVDLRCGDQGIVVYRCYVDGKQLYFGAAWMDSHGAFHICK